MSDYQLKIGQNGQSYGVNILVITSQSQKLFSLISKSKNLDQKCLVLNQNYNQQAFEIVLKYFYIPYWKDYEINKMNDELVNQILYIGIEIDFPLIVQELLFQVILPRLNCKNCLQIIKLSYVRVQSNEMKRLLKYLFDYCVSYFTKYVDNIICTKDNVDFLQKEFEPLVQNGIIMRCLKIPQKIMNQQQLLEITLKNGEFNNLVSLVNGLQNNYENVQGFDFFDWNNFFEQNNIQQSFFQTNSNYILNLNEFKQFKDDNPYNLNLRSENRSENKKNLEKLATLDKTLSNEQIFELCFQIDDIIEEGNKYLIISQNFQSNSLNLKAFLQINTDMQYNNYSVSVYLKEVQQNNSMGLQNNSYNNLQDQFTNVLFKIEIQQINQNFDQNQNVSNEKILQTCEELVYYSFSNGQQESVGLKNIFKIQQQNQQDMQNNSGFNNWLKLKIYACQNGIHSSALNIMQQNFKNMLQKTLNDSKKIIDQDKDRISNSNIRTSKLLEKELVQQCKDIRTGQIKNVYQKKYVLYSEEEENILQQLSFYNLFYILKSDKLNISHERFILFFLYSYLLDKNEKQINLILMSIRFNYLELSHILDFARDHQAVKQNKMFSKIFTNEIQRRKNQVDSNQNNFENSNYMENYENQVQQQQQYLESWVSFKPRKYYKIMQDYQNRDFNQDLVEWLLTTNHHEGFEILENVMEQNKQNDLQRFKSRIYDNEDKFMKLRQSYIQKVNSKENGILNNKEYKNLIEDEDWISLDGDNLQPNQIMNQQEAQIQKNYLNNKYGKKKTTNINKSKKQQSKCNIF